MSAVHDFGSRSLPRVPWRDHELDLLLGDLDHDTRCDIHDRAWAAFSSGGDGLRQIDAVHIGRAGLWAGHGHGADADLAAILGTLSPETDLGEMLLGQLGARVAAARADHEDFVSQTSKILHREAENAERDGSRSAALACRYKVWKLRSASQRWAPSLELGWRVSAVVLVLLRD